MKIIMNFFAEEFEGESCLCREKRRSSMGIPTEKIRLSGHFCQGLNMDRKKHTRQ